MSPTIKSQFKIYEGYLSAGNNILAQRHTTMSFDQASAKCSSNSQCIGFTFKTFDYTQKILLKNYNKHPTHLSNYFEIYLKNYNTTFVKCYSYSCGWFTALKKTPGIFSVCVKIQKTRMLPHRN